MFSKLGKRKRFFCFVLSNHFLRKEMVRKEIKKISIINEPDQNKIMLTSAGDLPQQAFLVSKRMCGIGGEGKKEELDTI